MNQIIPVNPTRRALAPGQWGAATSNFSEGVSDSFPRLSIRGGKFFYRFNGQELPAGGFDQAKGAILDVVLLNASKALAKSYYAKQYAGETEMPDCWSLDSIKPDPSVVNKVSPLCGNCPMNEFGSAPGGRGGKACSDTRRVVITTAQDLQTANPAMLVVRVPQQSLKNLKNYAELLAHHGYEPFGAVTRMSFDRSTEYPKLQFEFVGPLSEAEYDAAHTVANGEMLRRMLNNPDFDMAASDVNTPEKVTLRHDTRAEQAGFGAPPNLSQPTHASPMPDRAPAQGGFAQPGQQQTGFGAPAQQDVPQVRATPSQATTPQQGFGTQQQARPVETRQQANPSVQQVAPADDDGWEDLGDGSELNLATGEIRQKQETLELDPNVLQTSDGRFFNRLTKKFVASPYADAVAAPVSAEPQAKATRRRTTKPEAKAEPSQKPNGNGQVHAKAGEEKTPSVVAAAPKLEELLGELVPDAEEK